MHTKLTKKLKNSFGDFLVYHSPRRFSRNLRRMLLDYLAHCLRHGIPDYYPDLIRDMEGLFQLLDAAEDERRRAKKKSKK